MNQAILCRLSGIAAALAIASTVSAVAQIPDAPTGSSSCDGLWYQRNATFKAAGYCFRTPRGIQTFGNAGCQYDDEADVPLSARQRGQIAEIQATER